MHRLFLPLLLILAVVPALSQENAGSKNMSLFGWLNPIDSVGAHSASWGYVAPDGREYALLGSQVGTHIIDVTTSPIRQVAYIWGPSNQWREMKTYQQYLYIISESKEQGSGLQIVDLSGLPASATLIRTDTTHFKSAHTLYIRDHWMFINGTAPDAGANGGTIFFDLEPDPLHPRKVGMVDKQYCHDSWMRGDTLVTAAVYGGGVDIYDIRDKAEPVFLANINYPYSGTHNVEILSQGGYLVTSDEIGFTPKTMKVWDIRDLNDIRMVAEQTHNLLDIVHNVHVAGRYVVVSWYTGGVRIIDMIDPEHPREVAYYDTYPGPSGGFDGVWEIYASLPSGRILAGDRNTGMYVLNWDRKVGASVSGVVRDASTGDPLAGVAIRVEQLDTTYYSGWDGRYYIGGAEGDSYAITLEHFGYRSESRTGTLTGDVTMDIAMTPLPFGRATIVVTDASGAPVDDFAYAVDPHITSSLSTRNTAVISLPLDTTFTLTVGKWGFRVENIPVTLLSGDDTIRVRLERRYNDNATLDLGWVYAGPDDDATSGLWVRIIPYLGYPQSIWIHPATQPDGRLGRVFMTGAPPINAAPQANDVNRGKTSLISPLMDLRAHDEPILRYDQWFVHYPNYRSDTTQAIDSFTVSITNDDGQTWYHVASEVRGRGGWSPRSFSLKPILAMTDRMRVRFQAIDTGEPSVMFAAVDNFDIAPSSTSQAPSEPRSSEIGLYVAPNPSSGTATVTVSLDRPASITVDLVDVVGSTVARLYAGDATGTLNVPLPDGLAAGAYHVRVGGAVTARVPVVIVK